MSSPNNAHPFRLAGALNPSGHAAGRLLERTLEELSGLGRLDRLYQALPPSPDSATFLRRTLEVFGTDYRVPGEELSHIPLQGPAVVVANHPFGALEGVFLAHLLRSLRSDVRIMANYMLKRIPELAELFIAVDPFGGEGAAARNMRPLKEAMRWLEQGGLLVVFPAGEVSHPDRRGRIVDPAWSPTVARLVRRAETPVIPLYFHGRNSLLFQAAGLLHPRLRTALLPRELLNKAGRTVTVRIGAPLPFARLKGLDDAAMTAQLRLRTYMLGDLERAPRRRCAAIDEGEPVVAAIAPRLLQREVEGLPQEQFLAHNGALQVYWARAEQTPQLLQEIGRLRELTFRTTGEGTGRASDLDLYDSYYLHLFVWNAEQQELVGAYRLGLADEILARYGKKGLYTFSLFKYRRRLLEEINPAIELGRSFVRAEYQRSFSPLMLLWKGIGEFVVRHPRYRNLFGPVSISNEYHSLSQQLMVAFLEKNSFQPALARHVRPRRPFRGMGRRWSRNEYAHVRDVEALSELVTQIEGGDKGAPILLKQYLKLGGRLLGFNVDKQFSDVVDGLIMVDLAATEPKVLTRYMGRDGAERFLAHHRAPDVARKAG